MVTISKPVSLALLLFASLFLSAEISLAETNSEFTRIAAEDASYREGRKLIPLSPF
jgi:hypothetical protein